MKKKNTFLVLSTNSANNLKLTEWDAHTYQFEPYLKN